MTKRTVAAVRIPTQMLIAEIKELAMKGVKSGEAVLVAARDIGLVEPTPPNWLDVG